MRIVLFYLLASPLVCGRSAVEMRCLTSNNVRNVAKNLLVTCTPLSMRKYEGMQYGTVQWSKKKFAIGINVVLDAGIFRANLE